MRPYPLAFILLLLATVSYAVDFQGEILPVLKNNCLACHNQSKAKGGLNLETPLTILKGGDSGPAIVPHKPSESLLFRSAAHQAEPFMPPKDNKVNAANLSPKELDLIKAWIDEGATGQVRAAQSIPWRALPSHLNPILATALTADGQYGACSRGNQLQIYHIPSGQPLVRLGATNSSETPAHRDLVQSLAFSPDGMLLASGSFREVKLWRRAAASPIDLPAADVQSLSFTNLLSVPYTNLGTRFILSADTNGLLRLMKEDKTILEMNHGAEITAIAVRPDAKRFASAGRDKTIRLWNGEDGKQLAVLKGDRYAMERVARLQRDLTFADSEISFARGAVEKAEKQKKSETERLTKVAEAHTSATNTFQAKQKALTDATSAKNAAEKALADLNSELKKITDEYTAASLAATQATIHARSSIEKATEAKLTAEKAEQVRLQAEKVARDAAAVAKSSPEKIQAEAEQVASRSQSFADSVAADAGAKSKLAAELRAIADKAIEEIAAKSFAAGQLKPAFDKITAESPEKIKKANESINQAGTALAKAEKEFKAAEIARANSEHDVTLAKAALKKSESGLSESQLALQRTEALKKTLDADLQSAQKAVTDRETMFTSLAFSDDNVWLASGSEDGAAQVWSATNGIAIDVFRFGTNAVRFVAFGPRRTLIANSAGGTVSFDLMPKWVLERVLGDGESTSRITDRVMALDFSPDGKTLASGGGEPTRGGEILLWNVSDGTLIRSLTNVHSDVVFGLDFSPDGKHLVSGGADKFVRVTDVLSGTTTKSLEGHTHHVLSVSWKRDGRTIASAGADNVIKVWDFASGERKKNIDGFAKEVTAISFIGNTDQVVTASGDTQVRLFKENGESVRSFSGAKDFVHSAAATPDGKWILAGGQDGMLRVWSGEDGAPIQVFPPER